MRSLARRWAAGTRLVSRTTARVMPRLFGPGCRGRGRRSVVLVVVVPSARAVSAGLSGGIYMPEELGGLPLSSFLKAVAAEGFNSGAGANAPLHLHPLMDGENGYGACGSE